MVNGKTKIKNATKRTNFQFMNYYIINKYYKISIAFRKQTIYNFNCNLYSEVSDNKYIFLIDKNEEF